MLVVHQLTICGLLEQLPKLYAVTTCGTYSVTVGNGTPINNSNSLSFDGTNDWINIGGNSNLYNFGQNDFSIHAWINLNSEHNGKIVSRGATNQSGCFQLCVEDSRLKLSFNQLDYYSNTDALQTGIWQQVVMTRSGSTLKGYVNGQEVINVTNSLDLTINANLVIGYENGLNSYFDGKIDDVHIWSKALTQSEIQSYSTSPPTGNESGLVSYWNFNEGTSNSVTDVSTNSNNGTIIGGNNGATWSTDAPAQYTNNCTATDDVVVTVSPNPTVSAGADQTICAGASVTLSGSGAATYAWNNGVTEIRCHLQELIHTQLQEPMPMVVLERTMW